MAYRITEECVACGTCELECPNEAISEGEMYYQIDPEKCCECVGTWKSPQCLTTCPTAVPQPDPNHQESREELLAKFKRLNPGKTPQYLD